MKVKTISRNPELYERAKPGQAHKVFHNYDPELHPFEKAREYSRALNAVKLDRVFAKPFVANLAGHMEGVYCMAKHATRLSCLVSGACDGEIRVWNLANSHCTLSIPAAHRGFVRGLTVTPTGLNLLSCGADALVRLWPLLFDVYDTFDVDARPSDNMSDLKPVMEYRGDEAFNAIDHQYGTECFATVSSQLQLWDVHRSQPVASVSWGAETHHTVRWNKAEPHVLASAASDRTVTLYDSRARSALKRVVLPGRTNSMCWNPREPFSFVCANEDHNLYTFDMRYLDAAITIHRDHVSSVMSVDFSPTGREFVSGSYDQTLRIFPHDQTGSREVYFTRRMNRIFSVVYSQDARFVISGSDDANIRLWKADASKQLGVMHPVKRDKLDYQDKLKKRYGYLPEVRKIAKFRNVPKSVYRARQTKSQMRQAANLKLRKMRAHRNMGDRIPIVKEKKAAVLGIE